MPGDAQSGVVERVCARAVTVHLDDAGCPRCAEGRGCGAGVLAGRRRGRTLSVPAAGTRFSVGDRVVVRLPAAARRRALFALFVAPPAGLVAAGLLAAPWVGETAAAAIALGGFLVALIGGAASVRGLSGQIEVEPCLR